MALSKRRLPGTDVDVSALGFGCVRLTTCRTEADALATLHAALDSGVTHFDTARLYGGGQSERILGKFLRGRRDRVTVATKIGLLPRAGLAGNRVLVNLIKRTLRPFPSLLKKLGQSRGGGGGAAVGPPTGQFDVPTVRASFEASLAALGTDHVDLLLLHEATLDDAASEPLLQFLEDERRRGTVRALGIGSRFELLQGDLSRIPAAYAAVQFEHYAGLANAIRLGRGEGLATIGHSVFKPMPALRAYAADHREEAGAFSARHGVDASDPRTLGSLLLHFAVFTNPGGATLFSSQSPANIAANAADVSAGRYSPEQLSAFGDYASAALATATAGAGA